MVPIASNSSTANTIHTAIEIANARGILCVSGAPRWERSATVNAPAIPSANAANSTDPNSWLKCQPEGSSSLSSPGPPVVVLPLEELRPTPLNTNIAFHTDPSVEPTAHGCEPGAIDTSIAHDSPTPTNAAPARARSPMRSRALRL